MAFARQPLTPEDLYYAIRIEDPDFDISQLWQTDGVNFETVKLFILDCSKGLAELTMFGWRITVQFIHESERGFLNEAGFDILTPGRTVPLLGFAHDTLKNRCLGWLKSSLHGQTAGTLIARFPYRKRGTKQYLLLSYVVENIIEHAELACKNGVSQENFIKTFPTGLWFSFPRFFSRFSCYGFTGRKEGVFDHVKPPTQKNNRLKR